MIRIVPSGPSAYGSARDPVAPFSGLLDLASEAASIRLKRLGRINCFNAGQTLFHQGADADEVFELLEGVIKLYGLMPDGRRQIFGFLFAGQLIGLSVRDAYAYSAEAVGKVELRRYPKKPFETIIENEPALLRQLVAITSGELAAAQSHLVLLGRMTALERVASFLLTLAKVSGRVGEGQQWNGGERVVSIPMCRNDIADYLGLTSETISRTVSGLKASGLVSFPTTRRAVIHQMDRLRSMAEGEAGWETPPMARRSHAQCAAAAV